MIEYIPGDPGFAFSTLDVPLEIGRLVIEKTGNTLKYFDGCIDDVRLYSRAVAVALESIGDPAATEPLAELLKKPGMMGHAITTLSEARRILGEEQQGQGRTARSVNPAVREIVLARALYCCGDRQRLAESILRQYVQDVRGHFARYAQAVLSVGNPEQP